MKKILRSAAAWVLALALSVSLCATALAYNQTEAQQKADALSALNLFRGTENGYALDRPLTRIEALIMLVRLSGQENEALYGLEEYTHPFTDAPTWENADKYLAYAYSTGLTGGVSKDRFAPNDPADGRMFLTFTLRALGYTDGSSGAVWDNWESLARQNNLLPAGAVPSPFRRGDAVLVSYAALSAPIQGGTGTLQEKLLGSHVFSDLSLAMAQVMTGKEVTAQSDLLSILGAVYAKAGGPAQFPASLATTPVTRQNLSYYFGTDALAFTEALACEPMINASAHSVCLLRLKDGADVEQAKKAIRENVNPQKWICVGVAKENVRVENIGNLILLVMDNGAPDALAQSFLSLAK